MKKATDASIEERGARFIGDVYMRGPSPKYRAQGIECNVKTPGTTGTTGVNDKSKSE